jgi:hypothetical protein
MTRLLGAVALDWRKGSIELTACADPDSDLNAIFDAAEHAAEACMKVTR